MSTNLLIKQYDDVKKMIKPLEKERKIIEKELKELLLMSGNELITADYNCILKESDQLESLSKQSEIIDMVGRKILESKEMIKYYTRKTIVVNKRG